MAIPPAGSALEKLMLQQMAQTRLQPFYDTLFTQFVIPATERVSKTFQFKIRRAPYAADTWQMLDDLGIEPARRRERIPQDIKITFSRKVVSIFDDED